MTLPRVLMTPFSELTAWAALVLCCVPGSTDPASATPVPQSARVRGQLAWQTGTYEALGAKAKAEKRAVLIYLWSQGSPWCARLEADTLSDAKLLESLQPVLAWNADGEQGAGKMLADRFGVAALPVLLCFDTEGRAIDRLDGYQPKPRGCDEVARVLRNEGTLPDLGRQLSARPDDLELRTRYAIKLAALGDHVGYEAQIEAIRKRDTKRKSLFMRREEYAAKLAAIQEHFEAAREINPGPLVRFLEEERHPELLFDGYRALSAMHLQRADELEAAQQLIVARSKRADLRATIAKAASYLPIDPALQVGFTLDTVGVFARFPGDLSDVDKALLLKLSSQAVALLPEDARVQAAAALALFLNGDKPAAAAALRRAMDLEPDNPEWTRMAQTMGL